MKGSSTLRRRTQDPPTPSPTRLHPLTPPPIPLQTTYTPHSTQNPGPSTSPPENTPTPSPSPSTPAPPPPPKKKNTKQKKNKNKQTKNWRGGVSLRSSSGHPGVGSWGAETNPSLGGHPRVGAKSGEEGRRPPFFRCRPGTEKERESKIDTTPSVETRPDGRPGSKAEPRLRIGSLP